MAEIAGVPEGALRAFSQRRAQVLDYLERQGNSGFYAAKVAALQTRERKEPVDLPRMRLEWEARAAEHGFGPKELKRVLALVGRFIAIEQVAPIVPAAVGRPAGFSTAELLRHERAAFGLAALSRQVRVPVVSAATTEQVAREREGRLGREQAAMVRAVRDNRRQRDELERHALALLREGRSRDYLTHTAEHGRLTVAANRVEAKAQLVADWWRSAGTDLTGSAMIAYGAPTSRS